MKTANLTPRPIEIATAEYIAISAGSSDSLISESGQTSIVESTALSNYVNAKSGLYFALYLVFAMGMLGTVLSTNLTAFRCVNFLFFFKLFMEFMNHVWFRVNCQYCRQNINHNCKW